MKNKILTIMILCLVLLSCNFKSEKRPTISKEIWGKTEGKEILLFTLTNKNGMLVKVTNYGAIVVSIMVPDKNEKLEDIALGYDSLYSYVADNPYFGSIVGRYGNRIAKGKFFLNGKQYSLAINNGPNHLHGGFKGFNKQVWHIDSEFSNSDSSGLILSYLSKDMEEGYPGNLKISVCYSLTNQNEIKIGYEAETDKPTILNPTNHSYFNLSGCKVTILNHELTIFADSITPTDSTLIPTGEITAVKGTGFDFTKPHKIGERIERVPGGYDINYKLRKQEKGIPIAAEVYEPLSGRLLRVYTTEPGLQFYSGNFLNGRDKGHNNVKYEKYYGFCLEAQHFPDSPNKPNFPSVVLKPGVKYNQLTIYKFNTK